MKKSLCELLRDYFPRDSEVEDFYWTSIANCVFSSFLAHTILNDHFSTIGTKLAQKLKSFRSCILSTPAADSSLPYEFTFEPIKEDFVLLQLQQFKTNKAIGLDNISARLLKDSATVISASLTRLFSLSLETRIFPSLWKFGKVTALFKKGDRCDANNDRPITVLPTISKILEVINRDSLGSFHRQYPSEYGR